MRSSEDYRSRLLANYHDPRLELVQAEYSTHQFEPHFHNHYVIFSVNKGVNTGFCKKTNYTVTRNDLLIINPGEVHTGGSVDNKPLIYEALYIDRDFIDSSAADLNGSSSDEIYFEKLVVNDRRLLRLFRKNIALFTIEDTLAIQSLQTIFFSELLRKYSRLKSPKTDDRLYTGPVKKSLELMLSDIANNYTLNQLCLGAGISHYSFLRSFKKVTGLTPFNYLRNYRIEIAKKMLKKKHSIVDVALELGFFDQSHFHRNFRKVTGVTPGEYASVFK
jgi:AraC-like DNA-binding protein